MKSSEVAFRFPVLGFSKNGDVWGFPDLNGLTACGPKTLKDNLQDGLELVDADGHRWVVRSVRRTGRAGSIFTGLLTGTPQSRIEQELDVLEPLSLAVVQERVCAAMKAFPLYWCEEDEEDTVLMSRLAEVKATRTIDDIHGVLGLDTFQSY